MSDNGEHMGGFVGFLGGLGNLCEQFRPSRVVVVWESGGNLRKRAHFADYKGGRRAPGLNRYYEDDIPATTDNHNKQVSLLVKALEHLPVTQVYIRDTEADDVIGYLARYTFRQSDVILVSSDKDLYQLIGERVRQWSPGQKRLIDEAHLVENFGVSAQNFVTARTFIGDGSDGIDGVKGAGFKTLSKWFPSLAGEEFVSHNQVIEEAKSLLGKKKSKTMQLISESANLASRNWKLMYLDTSQLSATQIDKINSQIENVGISHKMNLLRLMNEVGVLKFDTGRWFTSINLVKQNDN